MVQESKETFLAAMDPATRDVFLEEAQEYLTALETSLPVDQGLADYYLRLYKRFESEEEALDAWYRKRKLQLDRLKWGWRVFIQPRLIPWLMAEILKRGKKGGKTVHLPSGKFFFRAIRSKLEFDEDFEAKEGNEKFEKFQEWAVQNNLLDAIRVSYNVVKTPLNEYHFGVQRQDKSGWEIEPTGEIPPGMYKTDGKEELYIG